MDTNSLGDHVSTLWTKQLYDEFSYICYQRSIPLKQPLIHIDTLGSGTWGTWDPLLRRITISERLIKEYSWDIVIEVLKHEMAHQFVHDVYGVTSGYHDDVFRKACKILDVADWAARAGGALPDKIPTYKDRKLGVEEEKLLRRAEKLLALASSSNEHEAFLAMQRVREIYARFNIEQIRDQRDNEFDTLIINRKRKRISEHESMIFSILNEHFFVRVIYSHLFDAVDLVSYRITELNGTRQNLLMAEYVYEFLYRTIHSLWNDYASTQNNLRRKRNSYMMGILVGFREKLNTTRPQEKVAADLGLSGPQNQLMIKQAERSLGDFISHRYPRITSRTWGGNLRDAESFSHGKSAGGKLNINKPISGAGGDSGLLLGS